MLTASLQRGRRIHPVDAAVAVFFLVGGQLEVALHGVEGDSLAAHALWALVAVAALVRRSRPLAFALVAIAATALRHRYGLTPAGGAVFAIMVPLALFGLGAYGRGARRSAALAVGALILNETITVAIALSGQGPLATLPALEELGQVAINFAGVAGGIALRDRTEVLRAARARIAALPSAEEAADTALLEERGRIARELHAVVSAAVGELLAEVESAREAVGASPRRARDRLRGARLTARRALEEMQRMLSLLRAPGRAPRLPAGMGPEVAAPSRGLLDRVPPRLRAQGVPLLVLLVEVPGAFLSLGHPELYGTAPAGIRLAGAVALAAAFVPRRRLPLLTALGVATVIVVRVAVFDDFFTLNLALYLAAFAAGAYGRPLAVAVAGGLTVAAAAVVTPALVDLAIPFGAYVFVAVTVGAAWATGVGGRRRLADAAELRRLAAEEGRRVSAVAERAVDAERLHVARELHDLVGHGLTSIILQCAGAELLVETSPGQAAAAIDAVERVGAEVEAELAELLAALAGSGAGETPGLARLPELIERAEASGMKVRLELSGDLERVPAGAAGAGYRIVQEGLTNARKHGVDDLVRVRVAAERERLLVSVENRVAVGGEQPGEGHGLLGISERVRLYAGRVRAGAAEPGGWSLEAELPIPVPDPSPTLTTPLS
jgi:signal transduction histidine kinase